MRLPLVAIPPRTAVLPLGSLPTSTTPPLLRFVNGLTIPSDGNYGLAIVGEGEGRRRLIQVGIDGRTMLVKLTISADPALETSVPSATCCTWRLSLYIPMEPTNPNGELGIWTTSLYPTLDVLQAFPDWRVYRFHCTVWCATGGRQGYTPSILPRIAVSLSDGRSDQSGLFHARYSALAEPPRRRTQ
jgi:hypothetical protein